MDNEFKQWCILELLGHVRTGGIVTEEERFGGKLGRIDIPQGEGFVTQYFGHSSVYRLTPVAEDVARAVAGHTPPPVHAWELRSRQLERGPDDEGDDPRDLF